MSYWLKMIGAHDMKLGKRPFTQRDDLNKVVRFPRDDFPPRVTPGDELIYYAVGGLKCIFAAARMDGPVLLDVPHSDPRVFKRWPHAAPVSYQVKMEMLEFAPLLTSLDPDLQRQIHKGVSYLPLGQPEFARAVTLIRKGKAQEDMKERQMARQGDS